MIIFDLDGTLADCEHRRHFVDPSKNPRYVKRNHPTLEEARGNKYIKEEYILLEKSSYLDVINGRHELFKPNWKSFYEACDKDPVISQTRCLFDFIGMNGQAHSLHIWSGRCDSVREKTKEWLRKNSFAYATHEFEIELKMRPIGDYTPEDVLKERWLDEAISEGKKINFVFDDRPKMIRMWRRRGIFIFNCCQTDEAF